MGQAAQSRNSPQDALQPAVAARRGDLERPPRPLLAADVGEIGLGRAQARAGRKDRVRLQLAPQVGDGVGEVADRDRLDACRLSDWRRPRCGGTRAPRSGRGGPSLVLSQLDDSYGLAETRELADATANALRILRNVRAAHGIDTSSPVNLCVSTGRAVVTTRFSLDYGWYPPEDEMLETDLPFVSLWYAIGASTRRARATGR
jgi:hypothetical protein